MDGTYQNHHLLKGQTPLIKYATTAQSTSNLQPSQVQSDWEFLQSIKKILDNDKARKGNHFIDLQDQQVNIIHQRAFIHSEASKFNANSSLKFELIDKKQKCFCGCRRSTGPNMSYCIGQDSMHFLGPGIIVLIQFLKRILLLFIVFVIIFSIFSTLTNIFGPKQITQCQNFTFDPFCKPKLSISIHKKEVNSFYFTIELWLGLLFCVVWMIWMRVIRQKGFAKQSEVDGFLNSSSDYSIKIRNLPAGNYNQNQLKMKLMKLWEIIQIKQKKYQPLQIKSIQIIYKLDNIRQMTKNLKQQIKKIEDLIDFQRRPYTFKIQNNQPYYQCKAKIIDLYQKLSKERIRFLTDEQYRSRMTTDYALIEFGDPDQQVLFLKEFATQKAPGLKQLKENFFKLFSSKQQAITLFKNQQMSIYRAPEPSDLKWQFIEKKTTFLKVCLVWLVNIIIMAFSFGFLYALATMKVQWFVVKYFGAALSVSIQLFNRVIWNTLGLMINVQQHSTQTDAIVSMMNKGAFCSVINTIVLPFVISIAIYPNIPGGQGLSAQTFDFHIIQIVLMIIFNFINVPYQIKKVLIAIPFTRRIIIRWKSKVQNPSLDNYEDYKQLLQFYQPPPFPVAGSYVYMITFIYHAIFYIHLQPILFVIIVINIITVFLVKKYLLLRRCSIPALTNLLIFQACMNILLYVPTVYGLGSLTFTYLLAQQQSQIDFLAWFPSILAIVLGILNILDPLNMFQETTSKLIKLFEKMFHSKKVKQQSSSSRLDTNSILDNNNAFTLGYIIECFNVDRIQSYYQKSNLQQLLNFEASFITNYSNLCEKFCQSFGVNFKNSKIKKTTKFGELSLIESLPNIGMFIKKSSRNININQNIEGLAQQIS